MIWPLLIEKGMAKIYGGYMALEYHTPETAILDILGQHRAIAYRWNINYMKLRYQDGSLWQKLTDYVGSGKMCIVVAVTKKRKRFGEGFKQTELQSTGLKHQHAYLVRNIHNDIKRNKYIKILNPTDGQRVNNIYIYIYI